MAAELFVVRKTFTGAGTMTAAPMMTFAAAFDELVVPTIP
jgi:hypothetical protein